MANRQPVPDLKIRPGIVEAHVTDSPARTYHIRWEIPLFDDAKRSKVLQAMAADALFAGRWAAGIPSDNDRIQAEAAEQDWQSSCECGRIQPCRHASSVMFRFRERAKADVWLWLETRGLPREGAFEEIHRRRLRLHKALELMNRSFETEASGSAFPILAHAEDPPFWNRDIAFADWLRLIYTSAKRGDGS